MAFRLDRWHLLRDLRVALMLLTRLPLPGVEMEDQSEAADAAWSYPLAGAVLAIIASLVAYVAFLVDLPAGIGATLAVATLIITSGAMHEDGLADCADGFWGGWEKARRLEIMRDSRIGAYGVLALVLGTGIRWTAYGALFLEGYILTALLTAAMLSRASMVYVMDALPNARPDGLSHNSGRPGTVNTQVAAALAIGTALLLFGWTGVIATLITLLAALACTRIAKIKIEGQTGDVLGATQQITEIAVLLTLAAIL